MINRQEAVHLLSDLISCPSINGGEGERIMALQIADYLEKYGVQAQVLKVTEKSANVVACLPGRDTEKIIVWNGHLDVVPMGEKSAWTKGYEKPELIDNKLYGRGASDMKSGLAAMMFCLAAWTSSKQSPKHTIMFCATCDEENNGSGARALLNMDAIKNAEAFLIAEPTALNVCFAEKGYLRLQVQVRGQTSHAAYADKGVSAVDYALAFKNELAKRIQPYSHPLVGQSSVVITRFKAGTAHNMVPDLADMTLDIRTTPDLDEVTLQAIVFKAKEELKTASQGKASISVTPENQRHAIKLDADSAWAKTILTKTNEYGFSSEPCGINYYSDASIFNLANSKADMILFGPGEPQMAHKADEYVDLEKYWAYIQILTAMFN